jgi:hypothetical protein
MQQDKPRRINSAVAHEILPARPFALWAHFDRLWQASDATIFRHLIGNGCRYVLISGMASCENHDRIDEISIDETQDLVLTGEAGLDKDGAIDFISTECPGGSSEGKVILILAESADREIALGHKIMSFFSDLALSKQ